jgi:hypothetical protein
MQSDAGDVQGNARRFSEEDLVFFFEHVLHEPVDAELAEAIQAMPLRQARRFAEALLAWTTLKGAKPVGLERQEALKWLWPEHFSEKIPA